MEQEDLFVDSAEFRPSDAFLYGASSDESEPANPFLNDSGLSNEELYAAGNQSITITEPIVDTTQSPSKILKAFVHSSEIHTDLGHFEPLEPNSSSPGVLLELFQQLENLTVPRNTSWQNVQDLSTTPSVSTSQVQNPQKQYQGNNQDQIPLVKSNNRSLVPSYQNLQSTDSCHTLLGKAIPTDNIPPIKTINYQESASMDRKFDLDSSSNTESYENLEVPISNQISPQISDRFKMISIVPNNSKPRSQPAQQKANKVLNFMPQSSLKAESIGSDCQEEYSRTTTGSTQYEDHIISLSTADGSISRRPVSVKRDPNGVSCYLCPLHFANNCGCEVNTFAAVRLDTVHFNFEDDSTDENSQNPQFWTILPKAPILSSKRSHAAMQQEQSQCVESKNNVARLSLSNPSIALSNESSQVVSVTNSQVQVASQITSSPVFQANSASVAQEFVTNQQEVTISDEPSGSNANGAVQFITTTDRKSKGNNIESSIVFTENPNGLLKCPRCEYQFSYQSSLDSHLAKHDEEVSYFKCTEINCFYKVTSKDVLAIHLLGTHLYPRDMITLALMQGKFACIDCGLASWSIYKLYIHRKIHVLHRHENHFSCQACPYVFLYLTDLLVHERSHHNILV